MRIVVSIEDETYERVRQLANDSQRPVDEVINELLAAGLKDQRQSQPLRRLGQLRGTIDTADEFGDIPPDVLDAIERPI